MAGLEVFAAMGHSIQGLTDHKEGPLDVLGAHSPLCCVEQLVKIRSRDSSSYQTTPGDWLVVCTDNE